MDSAQIGDLNNFIGGQWKKSSGSDRLIVLDPARGEAVGSAPKASVADLDAALAAAQAGFAAWRATPAYDRAMVLHRTAQLLRERAEPLAQRLTLEQGKPLQEARIEMYASADILDWYAAEGRRAYGRVVPTRFPGLTWSVTSEPIGPVAAFTPWNFPAIIPIRKIAPALAAGCSIILKPAEETPATALGLAALFAEAGLPAGVLNVVTGDPALISQYLIASDVVRKISFTGSTKVGMHIAGLAAAAGAKPATLELGGHAPVIICEDADLDEAVQQSLRFKFDNAGQACIAPTRFYVHDSLHDRFVDNFAAAANGLRLGPGADPHTQMGPLANGRRVAAMEKLIGDALGKGAKQHAGGARRGNSGFFYQPTVLADVPEDARIMQEEPFGPVAVTRRFSKLDDAITQANALPYGLAAYAFTRSARTTSALSERLEAGMVAINNYAIVFPETPFGGVKQSGYGSEGGMEGLQAYQVTKTISQS